MFVQVTKHKARRLTWGNAAFSDIFSLLSLGHWRTRQEHESFMSCLPSLQGHVSFRSVLVGMGSGGHWLWRALAVSCSPLPPALQGALAGCWGSLRKLWEEHLVFWPQFSNCAIYWPLGKPHSWMAIIPINWFFFFYPAQKKEKNFKKLCKEIENRNRNRK